MYGNVMAVIIRRKNTQRSVSYRVKKGNTFLYATTIRINESILLLAVVEKVVINVFTCRE